jgi:hypothetical protein
MVNKTNQLIFMKSFLLASRFSYDQYVAAEKELLVDANTTYHTNIGWATGFEIIATILVAIGTAVTFYHGYSSKSDKA